MLQPCWTPIRDLHETCTVTQGWFTGAGCYAEYVSAKETYLAHQPTALSFEEAGGVPLAALTAYQV